MLRCINASLGVAGGGGSMWMGGRFLSTASLASPASRHATSLARPQAAPRHWRATPRAGQWLRGVADRGPTIPLAWPALLGALPGPCRALPGPCGLCSVRLPPVTAPAKLEPREGRPKRPATVFRAARAAFGHPGEPLVRVHKASHVGSISATTLTSGGPKNLCATVGQMSKVDTESFML